MSHGAARSGAFIKHRREYTAERVTTSFVFILFSYLFTFKSIDE